MHHSSRDDDHGEAMQVSGQGGTWGISVPFSECCESKTALKKQSLVADSLHCTVETNTTV